jgi:hypothetical protein
VYEVKEEINTGSGGEKKIPVLSYFLGAPPMISRFQKPSLGKEVI